MNIRAELKSEDNPLVAKKINLSELLNSYVNDFFESGCLFALNNDSYSVALKTVRKGYKLDIIEYRFYIEDYINKIHTTIYLDEAKRNNYSEIKEMNCFIFYNNFSKDGRFYLGEVEHIDNDKMQNIIKIRESLKKGLVYEKYITEPDNNNITINKNEYTVPKSFFNQLTVENLRLIKNIQDLDPIFLNIISKLKINNILSITKDEEEMIDLLTDTKTPDYLKENYKVSPMNKIKRLFRI